MEFQLSMMPLTAQWRQGWHRDHRPVLMSERTVARETTGLWFQQEEVHNGQPKTPLLQQTHSAESLCPANKKAIIIVWWREFLLPASAHVFLQINRFCYISLDLQYGKQYNLPDSTDLQLTLKITNLYNIDTFNGGRSICNIPDMAH